MLERLREVCALDAYLADLEAGRGHLALAHEEAAVRHLRAALAVDECQARAIFQSLLYMSDVERPDV